MEKQTPLQNPADALGAFKFDDINPSNIPMLLEMIGAPPHLASQRGNSQSHTIREKQRIANRLSGFNPRDNVAWREISSRWGNIKQKELLSIAQVIANEAKIKLDRDARRRKSVLMKWFCEHWNVVQGYLEAIVLDEAENTN